MSASLVSIYREHVFEMYLPSSVSGSGSTMEDFGRSSFREEFTVWGELGDSGGTQWPVATKHMHSARDHPKT